MSSVITLPTEPRELVFCIDDLPVLIGHVTLPERERPGGRFNRYYRACAHTFEHCCRSELLPRVQNTYCQALENATPLPLWEAQLVSDLTLQRNDLLSLRRSITVQGLPHPFTTRQGDTWDLRRELLLRPEDCFPPRTPWRKVLLQHAAEHIQRLESQRTSCYHPTWQRELSRAFRSRDFYLTEEGFCFFFSPGSIAPAAAGPPTFCLPYNEEVGPFIPKV